MKTCSSQQTLDIVDILKEGKIPYKEIGIKYSITKQRVHQIAVKYGLDGVKLKKRIFWEAKCQEIFTKLQEDSDIIAIAKNNDIEVKTLYYYFKIYHDGDLRKTVRNIRDEEITDRYLNGSSAKTIINSSDSKIVNPNQINTVDGVYLINSKKGIKKYPNVGIRNQGGLFETAEVMDIIIKDKKEGLSCEKIAKKLNLSGYITITGIPFTGPNVWVKYNRRELLVK